MKKTLHCVLVLAATVLLWALLYLDQRVRVLERQRTADAQLEEQVAKDLDLETRVAQSLDQRLRALEKQVAGGKR